MEDNI